MLFVCLSRLSARGKQEAGAESIETKKAALKNKFKSSHMPTSLPGSLGYAKTKEAKEREPGNDVVQALVEIIVKVTSVSY